MGDATKWEEKRGTVTVASWQSALDGPGVEVSAGNQDGLLLYRQEVDDLIELLRVVRERLP
jgi:hypothetical protein